MQNSFLIKYSNKADITSNATQQILAKSPKICVNIYIKRTKTPRRFLRNMYCMSAHQPHSQQTKTLILWRYIQVSLSNEHTVKQSSVRHTVRNSATNSAPLSVAFQNLEATSGFHRSGWVICPEKVQQETAIKYELITHQHSIVIRTSWKWHVPHSNYVSVQNIHRNSIYTQFQKYNF